MAETGSNKLPLPPGLNLLKGLSAGGIFNRNFGSKQLIVDADDLSIGPTPRCADWTEWRRLRLSFRRAMEPQELGEWEPDQYSVADYGSRLVSASQLNIWAATGASDQLFIAFIVNLAKDLHIDRGQLRLLQFERMKTRDMVIDSMSWLNEENMAAYPTPAAMSDQMCDDYQAAWSAVTSPDPATLEGFSQSRPSANRWLRNAMATMLRRFPERTSGLPFWDRRLLEKVRDLGPKVSRAIGDLHADGSADGEDVNDWYFVYRLRRMAEPRWPKPLVTFVGEQGQLLGSTAELTPFGAKVAGGEASNYPENPIDDWAAGVKLSSAEGRLWFNDGGRLVRG